MNHVPRRPVPRAEKYYKRVARNTATRLDRCFAILEIDPIGGGDIRPVKGRPGVLRYRVGDLRVLYGVNFATKTVTVFQILPRAEAYKGRGRG